MDECFAKLTYLGLLIQEILNECMGLPRGFLSGFNSDRGLDLMAALRYFPATEKESNGISAHEDAKCITFVIQTPSGASRSSWTVSGSRRSPTTTMTVS